VPPLDGVAGEAYRRAKAHNDVAHTAAIAAAVAATANGIDRAIAWQQATEAERTKIPDPKYFLVSVAGAALSKSIDAIKLDRMWAPDFEWLFGELDKVRQDLGKSRDLLSAAAKGFAAAGGTK
jgi:hypothetical protein